MSKTNAVIFGSEEGSPGGAAFVGLEMVPDIPVKANVEMIDAEAVLRHFPVPEY